jgi:hypothetical protein
MPVLLIVAVDLIDTVAAPGSSTPGDLLSQERDAEACWRVEEPRVSAPVRQPGLLDDLCCRQPPAFMVRARRLR